jgi:hypothetical protein
MRTKQGKPEKKPIEDGNILKFNDTMTLYMKNIIFQICQCVAL